MSPDTQLDPANPSTPLKDARTHPMPAKANDQSPFAEGDLNQELIDQMLSGGDVPSATHFTQAPTVVHPIQFMPLTPETPSLVHGHGIELLMDVALEVRVELGRSHMSIGEILALRTGSVIELDKLAGEPVDVSVNGTLIARGEVVVVDDKFAVKISELNPVVDRV